jgi:MFS family permease
MIREQTDLSTPNILIPIAFMNRATAEVELSSKPLTQKERLTAASRPSLHLVEPAPAPLARSKAHLSPKAAFYLQASITVMFLAGSSAPSPLYPVYQAEWGFSPIAITVVFGIYALAVLAALLVAGRLSDHIGRKPVLITATIIQAATMFLFAHADGLTSLLVARVIQGLSVGAAVAAVGAGLLDIDKSRGTTANAVTAPLGTATGGLLAGLIIQYLPAPMHLVYYVLAVVFILQGVGVLFMKETLARRPGALASLKPQLSVPANVRGPLLMALPALISTWAVAGFYGALAPSIVRSVFGFTSSLPAGLTLFVLAGSAGLAVMALRAQSARALMTFGGAALLSGIAITLAALSYGSVAVFFLGSAVTGLGFGAGFQAAVRSVVPLAAPDERAGVLSVVFIVSYIAMGLPAVIAGVLIVEQGNIVLTAKEFGGVVMALATLALLGTLRRSSATA